MASPELFNRLSLEDGLIEWCSAFFLFFAGAIILFKYYSFVKDGKIRDGLHRIILLIFAGTFIFLGLEEVSWFQRILWYEIPEGMDHIFGKEFNVHNMATDIFENVYYCFAFVFFILVPYIKERIDLSPKAQEFFLFLPSRFMILAAALSLAFNYEMWNVLLTQICFFVTFFILIVYLFDKHWREYSIFILLLLGLYVATQVIFLVRGEDLIRLWDITEYKEFLIALSCLVYSVLLNTNINRKDVQIFQR